MNRSYLADQLRVLAAEPAHDATDPWPEIRRRVSRPIPPGGILKFTARAWATGVAAAVVVALGVGFAIFADQAQTANAAETLYQLQVEAASSGPVALGPCAPPNAPKPPAGAAGAIAFGGGSEAGGVATVSSSDAFQLSDRLAQALGVSGDRVRQAMRETLPDLPSGPPPDPVAGIANQLGVSSEQVCSAFANPNAGGVGVMTSSPDGKHVTTGGGHGLSVSLVINGTQISLDTETASQLSGPAQKLGVSPERLLEAIKASVPTPPALPPTPPQPDDIINRLAQNLGVSPDKVRAAITQVEGPNRFFFVVPLPDFGH